MPDFITPQVIWIIAGLALLLLEFVVPGLIIFFFGVGALVVAVLMGIFGDLSLNLQLVIFLATSVVLLFLLRRFLQPVFMGKTSGPDGSESDVYNGEKVSVTEAINPPREGKVTLHGTSWRAECDQTVAEGELVEVIKRKNLVLTVKKLS